MTIIGKIKKIKCQDPDPQPDESSYLTLDADDYLVIATDEYLVV
jgi:hypothetical protein